MFDHHRGSDLAAQRLFLAQQPTLDTELPRSEYMVFARSPPIHIEARPAAEKTVSKTYLAELSGFAC